MPPTPKDLKDFADKNRNSPKEVFKKLIDTTITHVSPHGSHRSGDLRDRVTKEVLSQHIAAQLSNHAPGDIMISGGTSLMLRVPHARITEYVDIITRFYPTKEKLDQLCRSMSQDPNDPFTYTCNYVDDIKAETATALKLTYTSTGNIKTPSKWMRFKPEAANSAKTANSITRP